MDLDDGVEISPLLFAQSNNWVAPYPQSYAAKLLRARLRDYKKAFCWYFLTAQWGNEYAQSQQGQSISNGRVSYFSPQYFTSVLDRISTKIRDVLRGV